MFSSEWYDGFANGAFEIDARFLRESVSELVFQDARSDFFDHSGFQIAELEGAEGKTDQAVHLQAKMFENLLDFPILAFAQAHGEPNVVALLPVETRFDGTVIDLVDSDPIQEGVELRLSDLAMCAHLIASQPAGIGMRYDASETAIVGEKQ